jgi:hypothetical protein
VISTNLSLDGVVQDPDGKDGFQRGGWFVQSGGKDLEAWAKVFFEEALHADALLLGRRSDEWFAARWVSRCGEWADRLNRLPKYVVSSSLERARWSNGTVLRGDAMAAVTKLKREHRWGDRRLRQLSARARADRARPGRRAAAGHLSGGGRGGGAPLRRDQWEETATPRP